MAVQPVRSLGEGFRRRSPLGGKTIDFAQWGCERYGACEAIGSKTTREKAELNSLRLRQERD